MRAYNSYSTWHIPPGLSRRVQAYWPHIRPLWAEIERVAPRMLRWLQALLLGPIWMSFEGYIALWKRLESSAKRQLNIQVNNWYRALYCLVLSLTVAQFALMILAQVPLSSGTMGLSLLHGLAIQVFWERGRRWTKRRLGLRSLPSSDPKRPFDSLDLGN